MKMTDVDLEGLYDAHAQALFSFLLHFTRNENDTRDVLQEIFVRLAQKPDLLAGIRKPRAFLLRMAHNLAIDFIRRHAAALRATDRIRDQACDLFESAADPDLDEFRKRVEDALSQLPPEQRVIVHLKLWEGQTFDEIAHILEIPLNTAASRYRYGLDKIRNLLRPIYDEII